VIDSARRYEDPGSKRKNMVTVELPHFQYCPGLTGDAKRL
jgi:hypothetical protein